MVDLINQRPSFGQNYSTLPIKGVKRDRAYTNYRENHEPSKKLKEYLEYVFDLEDPDAKAGPEEPFVDN